MDPNLEHHARELARYFVVGERARKNLLTQSATIISSFARTGGYSGTGHPRHGPLYRGSDSSIEVQGRSSEQLARCYDNRWPFEAEPTSASRRRRMVHAFN